jgi:hypothetical protein
MALNLYLTELDTTNHMSDVAIFTGKNYHDMPSTEGTLYYQTPIGNWQPIFRFFTDGNDDITHQDVKLLTNQGLNFISTSATSSAANTSGLYTPSATLKSDGDNYTNYKINDSSLTLSNSTDPVCNMEFQSSLSNAIFGAPGMLDMITNESDMATNFGTTINTSSNTISNYFASVGDATFVSEINSSTSSKKLQVCKTIFKQIIYSFPMRFTLKYQAAITSNTFNDGINTFVTRTPVGGTETNTSATIDVHMDSNNTSIDILKTQSTDTVFVKGDLVKISQVGPAYRAYKPSDSTTVGPAIADDSANTPGGGFMWNTSGNHFQINLLRNVDVMAYSTESPPSGSVEYWNGARTIDSDGTNMPDGNWTDPENYALLIDTNGNMNVYTNGGATVVEEFTQWTITGWGQTVLRGTLDLSVDGKTTLVVKNREYRNFSNDIEDYPEEYFTGTMYTEVESYTFDGAPEDLAEGKVLTVAINTTPTGPTGVQAGTRDQTIQINSITDVQASMLNNTLSATTGTELPIQTNDVFHIKLTVNNDPAQENISGENLTTVGDQVSKNYDLKINLSA